MIDFDHQQFLKQVAVSNLLAPKTWMTNFVGAVCQFWRRFD